MSRGQAEGVDGEGGRVWWRPPPPPAKVGAIVMLGGLVHHPVGFRRWAGRACPRGSSGSRVLEAVRKIDFLPFKGFCHVFLGITGAPLFVLRRETAPPP